MQRGQYSGESHSTLPEPLNVTNRTGLERAHQEATDFGQNSGVQSLVQQYWQTTRKSTTQDQRCLDINPTPCLFFLAYAHYESPAASIDRLTDPPITCSEPCFYQGRPVKLDFALFLVRCVRLAEASHATLVLAGGEPERGDRGDRSGGGGGGGGSGGSSSAGPGLGGPRTCGVLAPHAVTLLKKVSSIVLPL